jgi:hypothetical protein
MRLSRPPDKCKLPARRLRRIFQPYIPRESPIAIRQVVGVADILGRVVPVDVLAAWAGRRGPVLRIRGSAS